MGNTLNQQKTKKIVRTKYLTKSQNIRTFSTFDRTMFDVQLLFQALFYQHDVSM